MTFNNWKELCIGGNKLKRLVRVSDGLVLFELPSGPDYSEPFWIQGDGVTAGSRLSFKATVDPSTLSPILMSTDKKNWTPIEWTKEHSDIDGDYWMSTLSDNKDSNKRYFMRDSEVPIGFGSDAGIEIGYTVYHTNPSFKLGGNINSLLCKSFSTLTDISGLDKCFFSFMDQFVVTNIDELLLPSKQIGLSCY